MDLDDEPTIFDRQVVKDLDFNSLPPKPSTFTLIRSRERYEKHEYAIEKRIYTKEKLNKEQMQIYRYMFDNPTAMVLIQAGPGTGKTFTMLTLAHAWQEPVNVIIYKHDLLHTFRNCAVRFTVAKFCMTVWGLSFYAYVGLERQLSGRMSAIQFTNVLVGLLRRAQLPPGLSGTIVILDEYTVIPKPILFAVLLLLKHHRIGTVISGDKNQLQNIHNSVHTGRCSSYDIAAAFIDRAFTLTKNERCDDADYNALVDYVSRFSADKHLDKFGYALVAALFYRKFMTESAITDTHLASHHRDLTNTVHMMTINTATQVSFYYINASGVRDLSRVQGVRQHNGLYLPKVTLEYTKNSAPDKYLPYVPLIVGCRYFVHNYSEYSQAILESIDATNETVVMRDDDGKLIHVRKGNCNGVMFEKHRRFLLNNGNEDSYEGVGQLFNYPIYMANVMSIHMCQGRTIRDRVDMILNDSTYQGFYVSMSRVTSPRQIARVIVPDIPSHLVSTVINFPQLCTRTDGMLRVDELESCLSKNYMHYQMRDAELTAQAMYSLGKFFASPDADERRQIRDQLCQALIKVNPEVLKCAPITPVGEVNAENNATMWLILRYKYVMLALSLVDERDSYVWIHEFMNLDPLVTLLPVLDRFADANDGSADERFNLMRRVCGVADNGYEPNEDTLHYIARRARWNPKAENDGDSCVRQWYIDENETTNSVLETTKFRCTVYKRLTSQCPITIEWLMDQLRLLISDLPSPGPANEVKRKATTICDTAVTTLDQLMDQSTKKQEEDAATMIFDSECTPFKLKRFTRHRRMTPRVYRNSCK